MAFDTIRRLPSDALGHGLFAVKELGSIAAHVARYPAGVLAERDPVDDPRHRTDVLSPLSRGLILADLEAAGTPVVLVHGIVDNRAAFAVLRRALRNRGYGRISTVNYSPLTSDIRRAAAHLARHVERVCAQSGYEQVFVVGHSLGGVIARYYVQRLGGDARVNTVVTLGSPHAGTQTARLLPVGVARQLRPGSAVMTELAAPAECRSRFVAIYSDRDEIVVPHRSAALEHPDLSVTQIKVHRVGHLALLTDQKVAQTVAEALIARERDAGEHCLTESDRNHQPDADESVARTGRLARLIRYERRDTSLHRTEALGYGSATPRP
ncbi:alpha/beta fold hydrolase [Jatrophihabitans telluris]|uniref:Alpha/beta fold hydrolase n=1 Tax=Jatrophihabitans telluris TaxID=2038343 RepID=A0ABY4QY52_9ACTN|nr:alpha/beta fold hydrolase [Jatrophihabitans telluris]UQX87855.1 alpha/beta fold hydrolase [Jatrophihabitans telluris]